MQEEIDRILADEDKISPSPRFLESVMEAVGREAAVARPLAFPWSRAMPGILAMIAALLAAFWNGIGSLSDPATVAVIGEQVRQYSTLATGIGLQWLVLAVAITLLSLMLSSSVMRVRYSLVLSLLR